MMSWVFESTRGDIAEKGRIPLHRDAVPVERVSVGQRTLPCLFLSA